jgi:hypothetical protein
VPRWKVIADWLFDQFVLPVIELLSPREDKDAGKQEPAPPGEVPGQG